MDWLSWYKKLQRDDAQGGWQGRPATQREELPNPSKIQEGIAPALPYTVPGFDDGEDKRLFGLPAVLPRHRQFPPRRRKSREPVDTGGARDKGKPP